MLAVFETVLLPNTGTDGPTAWISFGVAGNELPVPVCSWGCSLKTAVFFSPVIRSIASEHKLRVPARAAAIIRRSNEGGHGRGSRLLADADEGGLFCRGPCPRWHPPNLPYE